MVRAIASAVIAAGIVLSVETAAVEAGVKDNVSRALGQFNRDLCRTFDLRGCKSSASKPQKPKAPAKAATTPEAEPQGALKSPPGTVPVPRRKPVPPHASTKDKTPVVAKAPAASMAAPEDKVIPVPRAKPIAPAVPQSPPEPPSHVASVTPVLPAPRSAATPVVPAAPADPGCHERLSSLSASFTPRPTFVSSGQCTLTDPVMLSSITIDDGKVVFPDQPVLNCAFAETFARWVKEKGQAAALKEARSGLSVLYTGPGFDCRGRNGDGSAKLSEHGYGNAVDITLIKLKDGRTFQVSDALNPVSPAYATLRSMRLSACERFSTVLGPGTNAAHAEHFHFDNGRHGKTGTYRICE